VSQAAHEVGAQCAWLAGCLAVWLPVCVSLWPAGCSAGGCSGNGRRRMGPPHPRPLTSTHPAAASAPLAPSGQHPVQRPARLGAAC
jgi:hypothetical protein